MYGLSPHVIEDIGRVLRRHPNISRAIIFGSRAKGNYSEGSDIDLALVGEGISYRQLLDIGIGLDDLGLLYRVDLVDYNKVAGSPLGEHIDRVGRTFYSKENFCGEPIRR